MEQGITGSKIQRQNRKDSLSIPSFNYSKYKNKPPLSNLDILKLIPKFGIKHFRGVFMRDTLPQSSRKSECGIVNLDSIENKGTHWVGYWKNGENKYYFDSFGLFPPIELQKYLGPQILSSTFKLQEINTNYCGYLCLYVLSCLSKGFTYEDVIFNLQKEFEKI